MSIISNSSPLLNTDLRQASAKCSTGIISFHLNSVRDYCYLYFVGGESRLSFLAVASQARASTLCKSCVHTRLRPCVLQECQRVEYGMGSGESCLTGSMNHGSRERGLAAGTCQSEGSASCSIPAESRPGRRRARSARFSEQVVNPDFCGSHLDLIVVSWFHPFFF